MKFVRIDSIVRELRVGTQYVAFVSAADYEALARYAWQTHRQGATIYARRAASPAERAAGSPAWILMHRAVQPGHAIVDHRNGFGLDNQRDNLRPASRGQNASNSRLRRDNSSGFKGVYWRPERQRWRAMIRVEGKLRSVGLFREAEDAAHAYDRAARQAFAEFAALNFPGPGERAASSAHM